METRVFFGFYFKFVSNNVEIIKNVSVFLQILTYNNSGSGQDSTPGIIAYKVCCYQQKLSGPGQNSSVIAEIISGIVTTFKVEINIGDFDT